MLTPSEDRIFALVLADGKIHVTVPEGTEGAKVRKYKTSDDKEGQKTELVYKDLVGKISKIEFRDSNFGRQLYVTVTDGDEKPVCLCLSTSSNYGEDMMKKLMNVDMEKPVKIAPYSFTDDKGKTKKGVTLTQHNGKEMVKITNYFWDAKKEKVTNGYPEPKMPKGKKTLSKDQWKLYFGEAREFLVETLTEHFRLDETPSATDQDLDDMVDEASKSL